VASSGRTVVERDDSLVTKASAACCKEDAGNGPGTGKVADVANGIDKDVGADSVMFVAWFRAIVVVSVESAPWSVVNLVWKLLVLENLPPRPDGGARVRGSGTSTDFVAEKVLARPKRSKELAPTWGSCIKVSLGL
jgi:hypothetical protein